MTRTTEPGLIQVLSREGNRRDAILTCALCGTRTQMHFYEPPGEPLLDGPLLWIFHFGKCESARRSEAIGLRLMWDELGRQTEDLSLDPTTRRLMPKQ